jgi:hypothetical protein
MAGQVFVLSIFEATSESYAVSIHATADGALRALHALVLTENAVEVSTAKADGGRPDPDFLYLPRPPSARFLAFYMRAGSGDGFHVTARTLED